MRGRSLAIASLLPYLGLALGPIIGGLAAEHLDWPWLFWILSLFAATIVLVAFLVLPETYAPILLARDDTRKSEDDVELQQILRSKRSTDYRDLAARLCTRIYRLARLLLKRPVMGHQLEHGHLFRDVLHLALNFCDHAHRHLSRV